MRVIRGLADKLDHGLTDAENPLRGWVSFLFVGWIVSQGVIAIMFGGLIVACWMSLGEHEREMDRWRRNVTWDMRLMESKALQVGMLRDGERFISTSEPVLPVQE